MSKASKFMIFCAEQYKDNKHMTGAELSKLFTQYGVWDYIYKYYESLHTNGIDYIIGDIDEFIDVRKNENKTL